MERAFWLLDRGHPFNGVQVVSLRGPLTEELLLAGLRRLTERHPALRLRVVAEIPGDDRKLRLTDENWEQIPLVTVARSSDSTWQQVVEQELNHRFSTTHSPTRVTWVRGQTQSELVFGQLHVTCDALSFTFAVRDLLTDLAALARGERLPQVQSAPLRPPLPSLLPPSARGLRLLLFMTFFFFKYVLLWPLRRAMKLPAERPAPPQERHSNLVHRCLRPGEMRQLTLAARAQGTSVHSALCAALLLAVGEVARTLSQRQRITVGCSTAISLRPELAPPVGEEMGLYISQVTTFHAVVPAPQLWNLARELKADLRRTLSRGEQYLTMPLIGLFIPFGKQPGARFVRRFDGGSPATLAVTNIGKLPIPIAYGPFSIESCHFSVSPSVVSPTIVTASTLGDALHLNIVYVEPLCSGERATAILDGALRLLRAELGQEMALESAANTPG